MPNESDTAKDAAKKISDKTNKQIMSNSVMALRQDIEERLGKDGDAHQIFEEKVKKLYGKDAIKSKNFSPKVFINVEYSKPNNDSFAKIYSKIEKVAGVNENEESSYALYLKIISPGKDTNIPYYEKGYIYNKCGRFAVCHDIGHVVINLEDLINGVTENKGNIKDTQSQKKESKANIFSYIQSDFRDFDLLELDGQLDLDKAFEEYKEKIEGKIDKKDFINIFNKSKGLYEKSKLYTMSYPIFALNDMINEEFDAKYQGLRKELEKKRNESKGMKEKREKLEKEKEESEEKLEVLNEEIKKWKAESIEEGNEPNPNGKKLINISKKANAVNEKIWDLDKKINGLTREINYLKDEENKITKEICDLDKGNPKVNIYLTSTETDNDEFTIDCYNCKNESDKENFYCFEIAIKRFSREEREDIGKEICKAIGCIYYAYEGIIGKYEKNKDKKGHYKCEISKIMQELELDKTKINDFAENLYGLRDGFIKKNNESLKKEKALKKRLKKLAE